MINFFRKLFSTKNEQEQFVKEAFSEYIDPKVIEDILHNQENFSRTKLEKRRIGFFLLYIHEEKNFLESLSKLFDYSIEKSFLIDTIFPPILFLTIGALEHDNINLENSLNDYLNNIPCEIKPILKGIYGIDNCLTGNIGSNQRMSFTSLLPDFPEKISTLLELEYGSFKKL